jgi:hypothetical protein
MHNENLKRLFSIVESTNAYLGLQENDVKVEVPREPRTPIRELFSSELQVNSKGTLKDQNASLQGNVDKINQDQVILARYVRDLNGAIESLNHDHKNTSSLVHKLQVTVEKDTHKLWDMESLLREMR